ncbi:MAG TPA: LacI family DNA-binding transcriptional regulator [Caldilineaceae bacterium]|nr:LacI family DNA-binding transcriptional regulator [Caldilineaceae bacterium]
MPVTLRDVAKQAGVSVSTASRALNGRVDVSKEVRSRVLAAAQELSYTVNLHARVLKGAATKTLGVILYNTSALTYNATMMSGFYDVATPRGYSLMVYSSQADAELERQAHEMLRQNHVDGVLINSVESGLAPLQSLAARNIPFVLLNRRVKGMACDYVMVDYQRGSYLAACHLLELGHRRILYQLGVRTHAPTVARLAGYRQALREYKAPFAPELVVFAGKSPDTYEAVLTAMQRLQPQPTAIMAYNDEAAIPIYKALNDLGLRVPEDVSVVGQNDLSFAPYLTPPLTTIAQAVHEMGRRGIEILLQKLTWPAGQPWTPQQVILAPKLTVRQSSARPKADTAGRAAVVTKAQNI